MLWQFNDDRPIYTQLIEQIELRIVSGMYQAGAKLPSVRDLASEASVNPNTMQKALAELERNGLVYSQRTAGRFITQDTTLIQNTKQQIAEDKIEDFFSQMKLLGYQPGETLELVSKAASKNNNSESGKE